MGKKIFGIYLAKLDAPNSEAHARLELPASPLELHDAMDKVQLQENEELYLEIDDYYGFEYLAPHLMELALNSIIDESAFAYEALLFQLPAKQKELLIAICNAGKAQNIMSSAFIKKHNLPSASFVQGGIKGLLEKDFVTETDGTYELYDKFFGEWLKKEL